MLVPLITNQKASYFGYEVSLGETADHFSKRPSITRLGGNKIVVLCLGASTQGQIATQLEILGKGLTDVTLLNCCTGGQDINDWLNLNSAAWNNLEDKLAAKAIPFSNVQAVIFGCDDLRNADNTFPSSAISYSTKLESFINLLKQQFVNLKQVDLQSRLCEYMITDQQFVTPSGYHNGWGNKFLVEKCISLGNRINNVWVTDATGYIYTDGETKRDDGFQFFFSWMKQRGTSVHFDTRKQGDDITASYNFNNMKRYIWFK